MKSLRRLPVVGLIAAVVIVVAAGPAAATWSLAAVDPETGQVGVAMASCLPARILGNDGEVLVPVVLAPGIGAGVLQGVVEPPQALEARTLLADRVPPAEVIAQLQAIDEQDESRQYGFVSLLDDGDEAAAQFTGSEVATAAGSRRGEGVVVQGVSLADPSVLDAALNGFEEARSAGDDLGQALAAGLISGSEKGGDGRCPDQTALFAHLVVARAFDPAVEPEVLLTVMVDEGDGQNPVELLGAALAAGEQGWIDRGAAPSTGISRMLVLGIGVALAVAAFVVLRIGMGSPSARR